MTNRNPASPYGNSSEVSKEILARVNAHADRSLDRIFSDIDDLLNDNPSTAAESHPVNNSSPYQAHIGDSSNYPSEPVLPDRPVSQPPEPNRQYPPQSDFYPPTSPPDREARATKVSLTKKKSLPLWMKIFLGIGVTSVGLSSLLLWLINTRKIEVPKNLDLSWLPFQSKSSITPDDAQFAEYMRKSIAKIDTANEKSATTNTDPNPANKFTSQPQTELNTSSPGSIASTVPATIPVSLVKILPGGNRPGAEFEVKGQVQKVYVGEKIADSNWSLVTVAKGEVIVKKVSGEIRSIYVGQKF